MTDSIHNGNEALEDHGHDHVPALATEIVDEKSGEDFLLIGLASFCLVALMCCLGDWMLSVNMPSGGVHTGGEHAGGEHADSTHIDSSHVEPGASH